jgi:hypothetical protein
VRNRIPAEEAFQYYLALGPSRSYDTVAAKYGASLRGVTKCASKHKWGERMRKIDRDAQEKTDRDFAESKAETRERHLKMLRAIETRGLQAIQKQELDGAFAGVKAIEAAIKLERLILGDTSVNVGISIQETTRREVESFLARIDEPEEDDDADDGELDEGADGSEPSPTPEG